MIIEFRKKKPKAKKPVRRAKRRVTAETEVKAPQFEPDLPMAQEAIEAEIEALLAEGDEDTLEVVDLGDDARTVAFTPTMLYLGRLQKQLFRVVFRCEPGPNDPLFWDRDRETEGVFPIQIAGGFHGHLKAIAQADIPPEFGYAIALTGIMPFEHRLHLYDEEELACWHAAVNDYVHQAKTGVPPITPEEFRYAIKIANSAVEHPNVFPIGIAGQRKTDINKAQVALEAALGTEAKAHFAMVRIALFVEIMGHVEFKHHEMPDGYSAEATIAAASAEVDRSTAQFDLKSFRERIEDALVMLQA